MAILQGTAGNDNLSGTAVADTLTGLGGHDTLEGGAGADSLSGGAGADRLSYAGSDAGVSVNLATGAVSGGHAQGDTLADANATLAGFQSDFEQVMGSDRSDTLTGSAGNDWLHGGTGGDDSIAGGGGHDTLISLGFGSSGGSTLIGGGGNDSLIGGQSGVSLEGGGDNDTLIGFGTLKGGTGDDSLVGRGSDDLLEGGAGADTLSVDIFSFLGGLGRLSYEGSNAGVSVNLVTGAVSGGHAQGDVLVDADTASGFQSAFHVVLGSTLSLVQRDMSLKGGGESNEK